MYKDFAGSVDEFIKRYPKPIQQQLKTLRACIKTHAPEATETISYGMPAYKLNGPLVYFGVHAKHIGFYPTGEGVKAFEKKIIQLGYAYSKGAIQFPLDQPIPVDLVEAIVKHRVVSNKAKASLRQGFGKQVKSKKFKGKRS
ncbi:MAG: iron chaperone [Chitinophagaceae bacterium]